MRSDIVPGATFPDYELPDHTKTPRKLSELQGEDPLILTLARGHYCPKEHMQHLELAAAYPKVAVAYTQIATISTDEDHLLKEFRASLGAQWPFLSDPGAHGAEGPRDPGVHRSRERPHDPPHDGAQAGPGGAQRLQRLLVLGPPLDRRSCGATCVPRRGRSAPTGTSPCPGLREKWDAGERSLFHGHDNATKEA